jgi:hypothetical protein
MSARSRAAGQSQLFPTRKAAGNKRPSIEDQLAATGLPVPEPEFQFALSIGRKWAFDFAWPEHRIALEIEGGGFGRYLVVTSGHERRRGQTIPIPPGTIIRAGGRHNTGDGLQNDAIKYNRAAILGWLVVRATTTMVRDGEAIRDLVDAFKARGVHIDQEPAR